jgi:hypothetical protein
MNHTKLLFFMMLSVIIMCSTVSAVPTTLAATMVGNNNVTLNANGIVGDGWFQFGTQPSSSWAHLPNVTGGGAISYTWTGTPIYGNTKYYYRACDSSGCGSEISFTTTVVTPMPTGTYGQYATNMTEGRFNPANVVWNGLQAYISVTGDTVFYGIVMIMLFIGMWLATRGTLIAQQMGMIFSALFCVAAVGLGLGLPPMLIAVGQALLYVSLAAAVVSFTVK